MLNSELKERATTTAHLVEEKTRACTVQAGVSLSLDGLAGLGLLRHYLDLSMGSPHKNIYVEAAVDRLSTMPIGFELMSGFSGLGWVLEHIDHAAILLDEPHAIELGLQTALEIGSVKDFDLVSGLTGLGLYGLERGSRGLGSALVDKVLEALESLSVTTEKGIAWFRPASRLATGQREVYCDGLFDVGIAHGAAGVVGFLCATARSGHPISEGLLERSVSWLLHTRNLNFSGSVFPNFLKGNMAHGSLPAWCYGDLGVAAVLASASEVCARPDWQRIAVRTALDALERSESDDASLCHGATGFALIARHLFRLTGDERFLTHVRSNIELALSYFDEQLNRYGFRSARSGGEVQRWDNEDIGLMTGVSGIALGLLACASEDESPWGALLLLES